jgi:hypothetical protein
MTSARDCAVDASVASASPDSTRFATSDRIAAAPTYSGDARMNASLSLNHFPGSGATGNRDAGVLSTPRPPSGCAELGPAVSRGSVALQRECALR